MLTIETISIFFTASVLLALSPGPDNVFVLMQSMTHGIKSGFIITLGLCTGLLVHSTAVILGLAVIFQTSEVAFTILKLLGAAYLLFLAWGALRAKPTQLNGKQPQLSLRKLYVRGIIMNITNPKVSIFFLAFLPQFVTTESGDVSQQLLSLSLLFILAALMVFNSIAVLSGYLGQRLKKSDHIQNTLNKLSGVVFIGLALKLVTTNR